MCNLADRTENGPGPGAAAGREEVPADELLEQPAVARELIRRLPKLRKIGHAVCGPVLERAPLAARPRPDGLDDRREPARGGRYP